MLFIFIFLRFFFLFTFISFGSYQTPQEKNAKETHRKWIILHSNNRKRRKMRKRRKKKSEREVILMHYLWNVSCVRMDGSGRKTNEGERVTRLVGWLIRKCNLSRLKGRRKAGKSGNFEKKEDRLKIWNVIPLEKDENEIWGEDSTKKALKWVGILNQKIEISLNSL